MYAIVLSYTTNDIITAVLACAVAHMRRKWYDCESEVWKWVTYMTKVFVILL